MKITGTPKELLADMVARKAAARAERAKLPFDKKIEIVERLYRELKPFRRLTRERAEKRLNSDV